MAFSDKSSGPRMARPATGSVHIPDSMEGPPLDTDAESVQWQLEKTATILNHVLETLDTLRGQISGSSEACGGMPPKPNTLASIAFDNRERAEDVSRKLSEVVTALFGKL